MLLNLRCNRRVLCSNGTCNIFDTQQKQTEVTIAMSGIHEFLCSCAVQCECKCKILNDNALEFTEIKSQVHDCR